MNGHPSHRGPSPEALVPGSSPSSLSPNLRHQRCWQTQRVTSLPSWGHWGGGDGGGAGEEPVSWGTPWGWAKLLQRAGEGCASQRWASQPFPSLTAVRHQRDIPTCQRNPKPLPTPSCSPQQSLSLPSLSLAPPTCLGMCPVLPPKPPTALCTGTSALLEIFTPIALACRAWGSPQLQLVQDPPI